jgi:hypothetical protein
MRTHQLLLFGTLALSTGLMLAQDLPSALPPSQLPRYAGGSHSGPEMVTRTSYVGGKAYLSMLKETRVRPEWESSAPLPLSLSKVEEVARTELCKLGADELWWFVTDFQICRFGRGTNWYYAVTLKPELQPVGERPESFTLLVDLSGNPGSIGRLGTPSTRQ